MASSATDSQGKDKDIRTQLVNTGDVDVMLSVGNNFFYTKSLPCTLWFFDKAKREENKDKVLFIDARNYYTVVDRTLNEWSEWQMKNLNAIVWLYRGEIDKYTALINEYIDVIPDYFNENDVDVEIRRGIVEFSDFYGNYNKLKASLQRLREKAKTAVDSAERKDKKATAAVWDAKIQMLEAVISVIGEAVWLTEKFGEGEYRDVLGLCKLVDRAEIAEKGYSLTPGAYVGVAPVEDDGVDFAERMAEIHSELLTLQSKSNELMDTISKNMKEMGI